MCAWMALTVSGGSRTCAAASPVVTLTSGVRRPRGVTMMGHVDVRCHSTSFGPSNQTTMPFGVVTLAILFGTYLRPAR